MQQNWTHFYITLKQTKLVNTVKTHKSGRPFHCTVLPLLMDHVFCVFKKKKIFIVHSPCLLLKMNLRVVQPVQSFFPFCHLCLICSLHLMLFSTISVCWSFCGWYADSVNKECECGEFIIGLFGSVLLYIVTLHVFSSSSFEVLYILGEYWS